MKIIHREHRLLPKFCFYKVCSNKHLVLSTFHSLESGKVNIFLAFIACQELCWILFHFI